MPQLPAEFVPFAYREVSPLSEPFGLFDSLIKGAKTVLKTAAPVLKAAAPAMIGVAGNVLGGNGQQILGAGANPALAQLLQTVIGKLTATGSSGAISPETLALLQQIMGLIGGGGTQGQASLKATSKSLALSVNNGASLPYAKAMVGPMAAAAIMEALPALMPVLQQVLTPETIKAVLDAPTKMAGVIKDGISESLKGVSDFLGAADPAADALHEKLLLRQNTDDMQQMQLVAAMSRELTGPAPGPVYRRVRSVKLAVEGSVTQLLHGRPQVLFRRDQDITFPLAVQTPRPIKGGILYLQVKNPTTLEPLLKIKSRLPGTVGPGPLPIRPRLSREHLQRLLPNEAYLISITLVWPNRAGRPIGTSRSHLITLVDDYIFDRVEPGAEVVPLSQPDRFRPYWHKVWQERFSTMRRLEFDCKYYYTLEPRRRDNARMETMIQQNAIADGVAGRMKSGLILSLEALNDLLGQISNYPRLTGAELNALRTSEFRAEFNHVARSSLRFEGQGGESAALWLYPEVKLQPIVLKQVERSDETGLVLSLVERRIYFPLPAAAHFIGVRG